MLRFIVIAVIVVTVLAMCAWLNVPGSIVPAVRGAGLERQPADFDIEFAGIDPHVSRVPARLIYVPLTPILGISEHYWSIIAPLQVDTISRSLQVEVRGARVRFTAPLGLAGLSNFRLQSLEIGEAGEPYYLTATVNLGDPANVDPLQPPRTLDVPRITVNGGELRYDGAIALWRRIAAGDANPYVYSPRVADEPAHLLWEGMRALHARIDLAPYPVETFVVPADWSAEGWKNEGFQLSRPHAILNDRSLEVAVGVAVPLPFARECATAPQFAVVRGTEAPSWSHIDGLWRPIPRVMWEALLRTPQPVGLDVRFVPRAGGSSLDRPESFDLRVRVPGAFRLFAACPNPHYGSLAVTWIDVVARPPVRQ